MDVRSFALVLGLAVFTAQAAAQDAPTPKQETPGATDSKKKPIAFELRDISEIAEKVYRPTGAGLKKVSFVFKHHAFENGAFPYRSARFHASFEAPNQWKLEVKDLHEAHAAMAPRLAAIMDWVRYVTGGLMVLDEALVQDKVQRVLDQGALKTALCAVKEGERPWQLKFREDGGAYYLHIVDSPQFGSILLHYEDVEAEGGKKIKMVTSIDINDSTTALGKWTLECEDMKVSTN